MIMDGVGLVLDVLVLATQVAVMNLPAPAESLCLVHMAAEQAAGGSNEQLFLYIGLTNGVCQRVRESTRLLASTVNLSVPRRAAPVQEWTLSTTQGLKFPAALVISLQ